jgi:hypothetical protein
MCWGGATCLPVDYYFSEFSTVKIQLSVQSKHHHHLAMIYLRNCSFGNNYSLTNKSQNKQEEKTQNRHPLESETLLIINLLYLEAL